VPPQDLLDLLFTPYVVEELVSEAPGDQWPHAGTAAATQEATPSLEDTHLTATIESALAIGGVDFAVEGRHLQELKLSPHWRDVLLRTRVFARMKPHQKKEVVVELQGLGKRVCMCGDGSNDCSALSQADVGLSLSEADASIAAHFTSLRATIASVPTLLREGRAALVTSLQTFKFIALYSLVQFTSSILAYSEGSTLGNMQYLYIDLIMVLPLVLALSQARAGKRLTGARPTGCLFSAPILVSLFAQTILQAVFQCFVFYLVSQQAFFVPATDGIDRLVLTQRTTALFVTANFVYLVLAVCFSIGKPYRGEWWKNLYLVGTVSALSLFSFYMLIAPDSFTASVMELVSLPFSFRLMLFLLVLMYGVCAWAIERIGVVWLVGAYWMSGKRKLGRLFASLKKRHRSYGKL